MKTIEIEIPLTEDRMLTLHLPPAVQAGDVIRVHLTESSGESKQTLPLNLPVDNVGPWPDDLSLRRQDWYDDDGR